VGGAFGAADQLAAAGHGDLAATLHDSASAAFFHGFEVACLVAAAMAIVGCIAAGRISASSAGKRLSRRYIRLGSA
jgi:hypothetical protein